MNKIPKVYLDTNIIIQGNKYDSCDIIRQLAEDGKILSYISPEVVSEQESQSFKHYFGDFKERTSEYSFTYDSFSASHLIDEINKQNLLKRSEEEEMKYWKDASVSYVKSTFSVLITFKFALSDEELSNLDRKEELGKLEELVNQFHIKPKDAIHLMHCHSAEMDYLLTRDSRLVRKSLEIPWLTFSVIFPQDFVYLFQVNSSSKRAAGSALVQREKSKRK